MNGGRITWNVTAIFRIFYLVGYHHMKGGSECPLTDQMYRFGAMVEYHPISAKDLSREENIEIDINLIQKSGQVFSSVMSCMRDKSGDGDIVVADIEELGQMDASELHARTQCKGSVKADER